MCNADPIALQIAIRKMLHEDDSMSMMLFFGFVGALNAVCLAPVLLTLHLLGFVTATGLTLRVFALTVCKGAATTHLVCIYGVVASYCRSCCNSFDYRGLCPMNVCPAHL